MIEKQAKLCYGVDGSREMKAEAGHRGWSYILGPGNAAISPITGRSRSPLTRINRKSLFRPHET